MGSQKRCGEGSSSRPLWRNAASYGMRCAGSGKKLSPWSPQNTAPAGSRSHPRARDFACVRLPRNDHLPGDRSRICAQDNRVRTRGQMPHGNGHSRSTCRQHRIL